MEAAYGNKTEVSGTPRVKPELTRTAPEAFPGTSWQSSGPRQEFNPWSGTRPCLLQLSIHVPLPQVFLAAAEP